MKNEIYITTRGDRICKIPNRERPKSKSVFVCGGSTCIKLDENLETRYPMTYVFWADCRTGESGVGWILSSRLRQIPII